MSTLVVIEYDDRFKAEEMRLALLRMQKEYLVDLEDAVVAVKDAEGRITLHQAVNFVPMGAVSGGWMPDRADLPEPASGHGHGDHGGSGLRRAP